MSNENKTPMEDIMQRVPDLDGEQRTNAVVPGMGDPAAMIKQATGLDIDPSKMTAESPKQGGLGVLTPEEAAQLGDGEKIDVTAELDAARAKRTDEILADKDKRVTDMLEDALASEEERVTRHEEALADEDTRKELLTGKDGQPIDGSGKVTYQPPIGGGYDSLSAEEKKEIEDTAYQPKEQKRRPLPDQAAFDEEELVPSYTLEEEELKEPEAEEEEKDKRPEVGNDEEYVKYVKGLEVVKFAGDTPSIAEVVKDKQAVEPVSSGRLGNTKILTDSAFLSSITKFRKDNFRVVSIPLVNSGFTVSIVGTGAVDLNLLYTSVDQNTMAIDYELEKMRVVLRNVVDTSPRIDPERLRNMIHFADYQLMAYAHIAATLKDVEMIQTCNECGKDFHIQCNSADLILNMDELRDRMQKIKNAESIEQYSLLSTDRQMVTDSGFIVNMGHPSYAEYIKYLTDMKTINDNMPRQQIARIGQMATVLPFIRSIILPNGVHTTTLYQRFMTMSLFNDEEFATIEREVKKMADKVITPKFGIKRVECPHCHKPNTDITYDSLNDLLFFHTMVTRLMNSIEE